MAKKANIKLQKKPNGYWTESRCMADAKKYKSRSEWTRNSRGAQGMAARHGWMEHCCAHMAEIRKKKGYWTLKTCKQDALKYQHRAEWQKSGGGGWATAQRHGWVEQCCKHMTFLQKPNGYWTKARCIEDAKKYKTSIEWRNNSPTAHGIARKKGWADKCRKHMASLRKPNGYWTKARCIEDAKKYQSICFWAKASPGALQISQRNDWHTECTAHMTTPPRHKYWTLERCIEDAKKYKSKVDWRKGSSGGFLEAHRLGLMEQCCGHMEQLFYFGPRTIREFLLAHDIEHIVEHKFEDSPVVKTFPYDFYLPQFNLVVEYHGEQHKAGSKGFKKSAEENAGQVIRDQVKKDFCKSKRICYIAILDWEVKNKAEIINTLVKKLRTITKLRKTPLTLVKRALTKEEKKLCRERSKWTFEAVKEDAKKYATLSEWAKHSASAYKAAKRHGWTNKCCGHMTSPYVPMNYWTFERIAATTRGFKNKGYTAWCKANTAAYAALQKCKRIAEIKALFNVQSSIKPPGYWTFENLITSTRGFEDKGYTAWKQANTAAYDALLRGGRRLEIKALFN